MKRLIGVLVVTAAAVVPAAVLNIGAQSNAAKPAAPSNEWPTYGHDPGGMRFSPLTQITPANVSQLQVAWVYHMRPAQPPAAAAGPGAAAPATGARARPRRLGLCRERDHAHRRQRRDVHLDALWPRRGARPDNGQRGLGLSAAGGQSLDARRRVLARRRAVRRRRSSLPPATAGSSPSTRRPACQPRPSATRAAST